VPCQLAPRFPRSDVVDLILALNFHLADASFPMDAPLAMPQSPLGPLSRSFFIIIELIRKCLSLIGLIS
jgi:hypothetical protein